MGVCIFGVSVRDAKFLCQNSKVFKSINISSYLCKHLWEVVLLPNWERFVKLLNNIKPLGVLWHLKTFRADITRDFCSTPYMIIFPQYIVPEIFSYGVR